MDNNKTNEQSLTEVLTEILGADFDAEKKSTLESKLNAYYGSKTVPKAVFNDKNDKLKALKEKLKERSDKQKDAGEWQKQIDALKTDYEKKLQEKDDALNGFRLTQALKDSKAKNPKAVMALLDLTKLAYTDDKIEGLDEQIESLKKGNDSYLFDIPANVVKKGAGFPSNPDVPSDKEKPAKTQVI